MPGFVFNGEKPSEDIVAGISQTLDEAGVPSILWSEALMTLYGVPTVVMVSLSKPLACIFNINKSNHPLGC
jgi:MFS superfamily sulfate permease-like transporter